MLYQDLSLLPGSAIMMELACIADYGEEPVGSSYGLSMRELSWSLDMKYFLLALKPAGKIGQVMVIGLTYFRIGRNGRGLS